MSCFQPHASKGTDVACVLGRAGRPKSTMRGCSKRRRLPTKPRYVTVASVEGTCPLTRRGVSSRGCNSMLQKKRAEAAHYDAEAKQAQDDQVPECAILPRNTALAVGVMREGVLLLLADVRTGGHGSQRAGGASGHARWRRWYVGRSEPQRTNTVRLRGLTIPERRCPPRLQAMHQAGSWHRARPTCPRPRNAGPSLSYDTCTSRFIVPPNPDTRPITPRSVLRSDPSWTTRPFSTRTSANSRTDLALVPFCVAKSAHRPVAGLLGVRRALEVFIIENLNPRVVPLGKQGIFCSGDAYLILHVTD